MAVLTTSRVRAVNLTFPYVNHPHSMPCRGLFHHRPALPRVAAQYPRTPAQSSECPVTNPHMLHHV